MNKKTISEIPPADKRTARVWTGILVLLLLTIIFTSGCAGVREPISKSSFMMSTFVTVTIYDSQDASLLDGCLDLCRSYENLFSDTLEGSEISRLNRRQAGENRIQVSPDTAAMLEKGLYYSRLSEGAFDITVKPLSSLWDFTAEQPAVPPEEKIRQAVAGVNYKNFRLEGREAVFLSPAVSIDPGAIAKGYIADRMKEYLEGQGVTSAVINLGGNVLCLGERPGGKPFKIGLQKPFADRNETIASLDIRDMSVVSSGVYERHFVLDGVNYHHILNPKTGYPYENGLVSVTIICPESVDGDGLSTSCFSMGLDEGMKLVNSIDGAYGIFITEDYEVFYSEGARQFLEGT